MTALAVDALRYAYNASQAACGHVHRIMRLYLHVVTSGSQIGVSNHASAVPETVTELGFKLPDGSIVPPVIEEKQCETVFVGQEHSDVMVHLPRSFTFAGLSGGYEVPDLQPPNAIEFYYVVVNARTGEKSTFKKSQLHEFSSTTLQMTLSTVA